MERLLDDQEYLKKHDEYGMLSALSRFPNSAKMAIRNAEKLDLSGMTKKYKNLVIAGMGGSAVGGILLRDWLKYTSKTPIFVSRGYHLPVWVDKSTVVYAVSYSGNTKETLNQLYQAEEIGCPIICFSSGGKLSQSASSNKLPLVSFPQGYMPRGAIAFQFFGLATISRDLGMIGDDAWLEIEETIKVAEDLSEEMSPKVPTDSNLGKALAEKMKGYTPFVYGSSLHEGVAYRFSTQLNENSKSLAYSGFFPEVFHNSIMAREAPPEQLRRVCAVIIKDPLEEEAKSAKIDRFIELITERFGRVVEIEARGQGRLARMISAMYIGDFASAYLGMLYGHDPSTNASIDALKRHSVEERR